MGKLNLLLIVSLFFVTFSCKKDDSAPSKKELLSGKNWVLTAETVSPAFNFNGILITDLYAQMDDCTKDDISKFNADGTYTFEEGTTKCDVNDPQVFDSGTWVFSSDQTILVLTSPVNGTLNAEIIELTSSKCVISQEETVDNIKYTITDTFQSK
jgi:hypothetical protein